MINKTTFFKIILFITLGAFAILHAEECTVGVVSGAVTSDGRPLLWKNRDSSNRDNEVAFFKGSRYDFIGVINANDTSQVWMGINTAGFAIMNSESLDQPGDSVDTEGFFMKKALSLCGSVHDFQVLLDTTNNAPRGTKSNFGCIDAYGESAIFETGNSSYTKFDANDPMLAPDGFIVRANFSMTGRGRDAYGVWRYHRAGKLMEEGVKTNVLNYRFILQKVARDLVSDELDPYPLPYEDSFKGAPQGFVKTRNSINRYRTVSCAVFHGVKRGESPSLATMWVILGEPVTGVAIPLWAMAGQVPEELDGKKGSKLNRFFQDIKRRMYHEPDYPQFLDSYLLAGKRAILPKLLETEDQIIIETERQMLRWKTGAPALNDFINFEKKMISRVLRAKY